jgi:hypothetical protein
MWSEYNLLVYMLIFDAVMGITVPLEFILHEVIRCPFTVNLSFQENGGGSYARSASESWSELQPMLDLAW